MRNNYDTKQKELVLDLIRNKNKEFLVKDIYEELNKRVGLTTIYRLIDRLEKDGIVNKVVGSDNKTYYEYLEKCSEDNHFYLKCDRCGELTHVDCDCISELASHVSIKHDFTVSRDNVIIKGICKNCKE